MTEDEVAMLREHLLELRDKTLLRLAARSTDGITDTGLVALVANVQTVLDTLEGLENEGG